MRNVPRIRDVEDMLALLVSLGVEVREESRHDLVLHARNIRTTELDRDICSRIRTSILFAWTDARPNESDLLAASRR